MLLREPLGEGQNHNAFSFLSSPRNFLTYDGLRYVPEFAKEIPDRHLIDRASVQPWMPPDIALPDRAKKVYQEMFDSFMQRYLREHFQKEE